MKLKLLLLVVGVGAGAALMHLYGERAWQLVGLEGREVEASVLEVRRDDDGRLVLMLDSEGESMLATFRERADDIASLVHAGDTVTFRAPADGVFSDDVPLLSVRRSSEEESEEEALEGASDEGAAAEDAENADGADDADDADGAGADGDEASSPPAEEDAAPDAPGPSQPIASADGAAQSAES